VAATGSDVLTVGWRCDSARAGPGRLAAPIDKRGLKDAILFGFSSGGHKNALDCIKAFSETDFTEDLQKIDVPTLMLHGDDDQIVPIDAVGRASAKLVGGSTLKACPGAPHAVTDTHKEPPGAALLAFAKA